MSRREFEQKKKVSIFLRDSCIIQKKNKGKTICYSETLTTEIDDMRQDMGVELCENLLFLCETNFKQEEDEQILAQVQGFKTASSGRFRFQKNKPIGLGVLIVTNKRVYFDGRSTGEMMNGVGKMQGAQDQSIPIKSINYVKRGKFSLPEKIISLGIAPIIAKLLSRGYVSIMHGQVTSGFCVDNPNKVVSAIKSQLTIKQ
jgi:hypothetical protein